MDVDRAHVKTQATGGTWDDFNILLLCRRHHVEQHTIGWIKFMRKWPRVYRALNDKGWRIVDAQGVEKLWNDKLGGENGSEG